MIFLVLVEPLMIFELHRRERTPTISKHEEIPNEEILNFFWERNTFPSRHEDTA